MFMSSLSISAVCGCAAVWLLMPSSAVSADGLRAGTARIDITPDNPVTLAGYASRTNVSRGVHDPLTARAVAFEHEGKRLVLVSTEICGFYGGTAAPMREAILSACQLKPSELFLCATHTHSAPAVTADPQKGHPNNVEYTQSLQGKLVEVVRDALGDLVPVRLSVGTGASPVGVNRREPVRDKAGKPRIVLGRNPSALTDREVQVLNLMPIDGNDPMGVIFAYATHSTSLGPRNYLVSGDVHGLAAQFIEKHLGGDTMVQPFAGASGDIDPWYRILPEFNTTNGWIPEPILLGTMLGQEVVHVSKAAQRSEKRSETNTSIRSLFKTIDLPGKSRGATQAASGGTDGTAPLTLTVGRIGEVAFVGLGGEVFNEIGRAIKAGSPFPLTFIFTHCNGAGGYLPARASYPDAGYEVQSSPFAPGADEQVIEQVMQMLRAIQ